MSQSMYEWEASLSEVPDYESTEAIEADQIYLEPNNVSFKAKCGSSCILLI